MVFGGALLMRQVMTGRVMETPQDIRDITLGLLNGDFQSVKSTLSQRGENASPDVSGTVAAGTSGGASLSDLLTTPLTGDLLAEMVKLGNAAKGYRLGATGPEYYDCSGLVWAAMRNLGIYKGARFTTKSFVSALGSEITQVTKPVAGDVVLWPGKHMGVVSGSDKMYSAMSPSNGIGYASISKSSPTIGGAPVFYRTSDVASAVPDQGGN